MRMAHAPLRRQARTVPSARAGFRAGTVGTRVVLGRAVSARARPRMRRWLRRALALKRNAPRRAPLRGLARRATIRAPVGASSRLGEAEARGVDARPIALIVEPASGSVASGTRA